jgi:phage terminase large subunit-like protein
LADEIQLSDSDGIDAAYIAQSENNFLLFVEGLIINSGKGPQLFSECMEPFQRETFQGMAPSLHAVREGTTPNARRWWIERTKGAGKDSDLACCLMWLLAFPHRPCYLQVGAADKDQAAIVRRRMEDLLFYNPWLSGYVDIQVYKAYSKPDKLCELDILAADIGGSHGGLPDLLLINELSHVLKWEFIQNLLDNARKAPRGMIVVATNAGFKGTKAEKLRTNAMQSAKRWTVKLWQRPAPWINMEDVKEASINDQPSRVNRLWWGKWASGQGDALSEEGIDACLKRHKGPLTKPEKGWQYIAGLDLGVSHDHAGFVVLGVQQIKQRVRLAWMKRWIPDKRTREVDLINVKETVFSMSRQFKLRSVGYDPTEARLMAQELRRLGVPMNEMSFASPKNLNMMAAYLVQVVGNGKLEAYEDEDGWLRRDFGKLNVVERTYGFKLESTSDEYGHADVAAAVAIALPRAVDMLAGRAGLQEGDSLADGTEEDLSEQEIKDLPDELRELYEDNTAGQKGR